MLSFFLSCSKFRFEVKQYVTISSNTKSNNGTVSKISCLPFVFIEAITYFSLTLLTCYKLLVKRTLHSMKYIATN